VPGFTAGQEVVASVLAYEIGHNLGLGLVTEAWDLLQSSGQPNQGEMLNAPQISAAPASPFALAIPEPALLALWLMAVLVLRSRAAA